MLQQKIESNSIKLNRMLLKSLKESLNTVAQSRQNINLNAFTELGIRDEFKNNFIQCKSKLQNALNYYDSTYQQIKEDLDEMLAGNLAEITDESLNSIKNRIESARKQLEENEVGGIKYLIQKTSDARNEALIKTNAANSLQNNIQIRQIAISPQPETLSQREREREARRPAVYKRGGRVSQKNKFNIPQLHRPNEI